MTPEMLTLVTELEMLLLTSQPLQLLHLDALFACHDAFPESKLQQLLLRAVCGAVAHGEEDGLALRLRPEPGQARSSGHTALTLVTLTLLRDDPYLLGADAQEALLTAELHSGDRPGALVVLESLQITPEAKDASRPANMQVKYLGGVLGFSGSQAFLSPTQLRAMLGSLNQPLSAREFSTLLRLLSGKGGAGGQAEGHGSENDADELLHGAPGRDGEAGELLP